MTARDLNRCAQEHPRAVYSFVNAVVPLYGVLELSSTAARGLADTEVASR